MAKHIFGGLEASAAHGIAKRPEKAADLVERLHKKRAARRLAAGGALREFLSNRFLDLFRWRQIRIAFLDVMLVDPLALRGQPQRLSIGIQI